MKKKKRKIIYHRLAILIISSGLILAFFIAGINKIIEMISSPDIAIAIEDKKSESTAQKKVDRKIVVLDPGHGGYDEGSSGIDGSIEKDITLSIALQVGDILKKENINVIYTREDDDVYWTNSNYEDLMSRVNIATENDTSLFLSIHCNFSEEGSDIRGHEVWASLTSQSNYDFANNISSALERLGYNQNRGIKDERNDNLLVLHYNPVTSALVELGFMSNQQDMDYMKSKEGQKKLAQALASAIMGTLGN